MRFPKRKRSIRNPGMHGRQAAMAPSFTIAASVFSFVGWVFLGSHEDTAQLNVLPGRAFVFTNAKTEDCLRKQTISPPSRKVHYTENAPARNALFGIQANMADK